MAQSVGLWKYVDLYIHNRGRCYDHNFGEKIGVFLKNQCYDQMFAKFSFVLSQKRQFFAEFFGENISKIITSVPGLRLDTRPGTNDYLCWENFRWALAAWRSGIATAWETDDLSLYPARVLGITANFDCIYLGFVDSATLVKFRLLNFSQLDTTY
jgi:hypothetical protein